MTPAECFIQRDVDVYLAMSRGRTVAEKLGLKPVDRTRVEIVILELSRNLLAHAGGGKLTMSIIDDPVHGLGMAITAEDTGPGITDIDLAMQDGYSTAHTLGAGLPGVRRLTDVFHIESEVGVGTRVYAVKWLSPSRRSIYER
ncbi:anti-sigma regulatory factor [Oscillochloris sp. ZM17-4]|uniref:anti-sigma regulatory factor n=1 Tax=Oscillochloris sp. ZM17-4 TaxID=2866714 RepID=UPI001C7366E8|nr:anti-sigma regulatory factor [Oscillochloris sp. ZM17-4]MBX0328953.1 anti-sigma regulatory factor [Oscillochloris sp. ZM17-4]